MARLMAVANGNNTSSSTWALIDSASFLESETSINTVGTSYTGSSNFTPGAITVDGVAIKIAARIGTTGTFSIELYNSTLAASVAGSEVTVNMTDFVDALNTGDGGWMFFKFATPILLIAVTNYQVRVKTSAASMLSLFNSGTSNWSRILRTTTTQAPAAGDDRWVNGEWTAAGTTTTRTVTLNDTSSVDYGSASTSQVTPALSISAGGVVVSGLTASTTYVQKISGNVVVYNGGELTLGTTAGRMPTNSSFTWTFDCVSNIDFGIDYRRKSIGYMAGEDKVRWTYLTADKAAAATVIQVVSTAGWKAGDTLLFTGTGTVTTAGETKTILTVDSSTQVTLTAGLTSAHTGTGDCIGEVGNITSNVKIVGTSATVGTFVCCKGSSNIIFDNTEFGFIGGSTTNKRGVEIQHLTTSVNSGTFNKCAFRNIVNGGLVGALAFGSLWTITDCVACTAVTSTNIVSVSSANNGVFTFTGNLVSGIQATPGTGIVCSVITSGGGVFSNNNIASCGTGIAINSLLSIDTITEISSCKVHTCTTGITSNGGQRKIVDSFDIVSCTTGIGGMAGSTYFISCNILGNASAGVSGILGGSVWTILTFTYCVFRGRTSFAQGSGATFVNAYNHGTLYVFNSCTFGVSIAHSTADINVAAAFGGRIICNNCTFASTNEVNSTAHTFLDEYASIALQRIDTTAANHRTHVRQAIITPDTVIYRTASPSLRITPKSATIPCTTVIFSFKVPINSGQTCTPTVYVRESETGDGAVYNGSRVKLYVKANYSLGITSDTLLDTATAASDGAFEALTGTTATVTDAGVLEFYLVCDGTVGWVNADDFSAVNA